MYKSRSQPNHERLRHTRPANQRDQSARTRHAIQRLQPVWHRNDHQSTDGLAHRASLRCTRADDQGERHASHDGDGIRCLWPRRPGGEDGRWERWQCGCGDVRNVFPAGQPRTQTNANGAVTTFSLDGLNHVIETRTNFGTASELVSTYTHDPNGNKVRERDRRGVERLLVYKTSLTASRRRKS